MNSTARRRAATGRRRLLIERRRGRVVTGTAFCTKLGAWHQPAAAAPLNGATRGYNLGRADYVGPSKLDFTWSAPGGLGEPGHSTFAEPSSTTPTTEQRASCSPSSPHTWARISPSAIGMPKQGPGTGSGDGTHQCTVRTDCARAVLASALAHQPRAACRVSSPTVARSLALDTTSLGAAVCSASPGGGFNPTRGPTEPTAAGR